MRNIILGLLVVAACTPKPKPEEAEKLTWYKGNTHSHTVLCGHADSHPDTVATWYLDRNYNFLILSEHNEFIDPASVNLPEERREDFILIPGVEVSDAEQIHTTAMNVNRVIPTQRPEPVSSITNNPFSNYKMCLMQKHVDSIRSAGGIPILNHPNWESGVSAANIEQVERLHMIELYNGHPEVNNWGNENHASMEQKWDSLLTAGRKIFGVSSDDAHFFQDWGVDVSNPGRGWVMVQCEKLTPDAITNAMAAGDFYSSSGVILSDVNISKKVYEVSVDTASTYRETESPFIIGFRSDDSADGYWIEFVGDNGKVLQRIDGIRGSFDIPSNVSYVRAKITFSRNRGSSSEQFFAWTQPVFLK